MAGLVNPLLSGLNVVLTYLFVKRLYGVAAALATSMLLAVSPWSLFMAMSYMSHTVTIALGLGLAIVLSRLHDVFRPVHAASVGMLVGAAVLMRPLDGWVLMLAAGLYLLTLIPRHGVRPLIWVILGGLPFLVVQLGYNSLLTGEPTRFPLMAYYDEYHGPGVNTLGFGPAKGRHWPSLDAFPGHSPVESLINANMNLFAINSEMFGWVTGSLWPVILLLVWGRLRQTDVLLMLVILINVGVFALYWSSGGPDFGARYWSISLVPLLVLTVRGASELGERLSRVVADRPPGIIWVLVAMSCLTFMSLIAYLPWRCVDKYYRYLGMHPAAERLASKYEFGESLVLVYGGYFDYLSAAVYNPVNLNAPQPVYAWARNAQVQSEVLRAYSHRPVWIVRGSAVAPHGQWTAEGPILPSERSYRLSAPPDIDTALP
jgi:hypothetical protein